MIRGSWRRGSWTKCEWRASRTANGPDATGVETVDGSQLCGEDEVRDNSSDTCSAAMIEALRESKVRRCRPRPRNTAAACKRCMQHSENRMKFAPRCGRFGPCRMLPDSTRTVAAQTSTNCATLLFRFMHLPDIGDWDLTVESTRPADLRARPFCTCGLCTLPAARPDGRGWDETEAGIRRSHARPYVEIRRQHSQAASCRPDRQHGRHGTHSRSFRAATWHGTPPPTIKAVRKDPHRNWDSTRCPGPAVYYRWVVSSIMAAGVFGAGRATDMKRFEAIGMDVEKSRERQMKLHSTDGQRKL